MSVSLIWHGHSAFTLEVDGSKLVIDPFLDGNPSAIVSAADIAADYILLTHGHGDHIGDTLALAFRTQAQVIANFEIAGWIGTKGYANVHAQYLGGGYHHPFGHLKFTIAFHGSGLPDGSYGGNPAGFLLNVGGKRIYISGDTALFSDMALIGKGGLDLAVLCVGDNFTMGPEDSIEAINYLKPKVVVPCHYNTWPVIAVDIEKWAKQVSSETNSKPILMNVEGRYAL